MYKKWTCAFNVHNGISDKCSKESNKNIHTKPSNIVGAVGNRPQISTLNGGKGEHCLLLQYKIHEGKYVYKYCTV